MSIVYQSPVRAGVVLEAIANGVSPDTMAYRAAVAYASREGARVLTDSLASRMGTKWKKVPKTIVTCFDFGATEPDALEHLQAEGFEVRIANLRGDGQISLMPRSSSFHPKIYLATEASRVRSIIGSANISRRALTINTEVVKTAELTNEEANAVWNPIVAKSEELTSDLLARYRKIRPRQQATSSNDEPATPPSIDIDALPVFQAAVEAEQIVPPDHQAFWLEVVSTSGGAGSQVELPRRGHRFFGYRFDDYDNEQRDIGEPTITTDDIEHSCKIAWHGDNRMERINLPTKRQGGFDYAYRVVLFERQRDSFAITVADKGSRQAEQWHDESAAADKLFKVGAKSDRLCGLI